MRSNITEKELIKIYTPQAEDIEFIKAHTYTSISTLGFLILLKTFQRLGYFPTMDQVPTQIIRHIAANSGLQRFVPVIHKYDNVGSRWKHKNLIRTFLGVKSFVSGGFHTKPQNFRRPHSNLCQLSV